MDGIYSNVALWSDVSASNLGGVANLPTFASPIFLGLDKAFNTLQYKKSFDNFTMGVEFTSPDVSYRTGGTATHVSDLTHNFRAGLERKEAGGLTLFYDNGIWGVGFAGHTTRLSLSHNADNFEAKEVEKIKYHVRTHDAVFATKLTLNRWFFSASTSIERVDGSWNGDSGLGPLVKNYKRYGYALSTLYDMKNNDVSWVFALEYDFSRAKQKIGLNENNTEISMHPSYPETNNINYTLPPLSVSNNFSNDLSSKRADPFNTNKIIASAFYYFTPRLNAYLALAKDLRPTSEILNSSMEKHVRENQYSVGIVFTL